MHTGNQIREKFLKYFESHGHARVASSSLIPQNDPTLFFTNAGMVQFKDVFTGREERPYKTATTSQKCLRVSGKHNDLENVGRTPRHHTFFEMLGNFSFGDYFKSKAIAYAWEFLTREVGLPKEWLWITIFQDDDEAGDIWHNEIGIPRERIVKCGEKDNFWSMGETGPCGPCSEIFVDLKQLHGEGVALGTPATNDNDFMEIWNLVFMQFNRDAKGGMTPLPKPSIDTGMGLERLCSVLQKKKSNYDTDLFLPLIKFFASRTGHEYGKNSETDVSLRVMADHIRATVFLIGDGVLPSNEGRGYVLRRVMRRAIRHGRILGMKESFFHQATETLVREMGGVYPDMAKNQSTIEKVIRIEEERFLETLEKGLVFIEEELAKTGKVKGLFDGVLAFKLYDTYGFPVDLTEIIVGEKGLAVDMAAFDAEMAAQKKRARAAWKGSGAESVGDMYHALVREGKTTQFIGYDHLEGEGKVLALLKDGARVESVAEGDAVEVFVDVTPFYAESGGQVGDVGSIDAKSATLEVVDTRKPVDKIFSHRATVTRGTLKVGDAVHLAVSAANRRPIMLNHTATHILHAALREVLGEHVRQAGSLVESEKLRFDFNHYEALTAAQIEAIEKRVNGVILSNFPVTKEEMSQEQAKKKGALAFFGDKYGDRVRVVTVGPYSMEFCGGTHLNASGEIGLLKIVSESSVAAGVRRIEAVTGAVAFELFQKTQKELDTLAALLKTTPEELPARVKKSADRIKELEREVAGLKTKLASGGGTGTDYLTQVKEVRGVRLLPLETQIDDPKALREFADQVKQRLKSGIAVIASKADGKVSLLVTVSPDLTAKYQAGKIIAQLAGIVGGKGGGRPDMAQAGGNLPEKIPEVFSKLEELI